MGYPRLPVYVRNDPYGPKGHNDLLQRTDQLVAQFGAEHHALNGLHNTPHVARALGHLEWGGASYTDKGFTTYPPATITNPTPGTIRLRFASAFAFSGFSTDTAIIEVQPSDDTGGGDGHPWLSSAAWVNSLEVEIYLKKNTASLGSQQTFAATDGDFFVGIRTPAAPGTAAGNASGRRMRGDGLVVDPSNWNPAVQKLGDHRYASLIEHTSAGLHNAREVSKAWGYAKWNSTTSTYQWLGHQGLGAGIIRQSTGVVRVYLANCVPAISTPVQAFVRPIAAVTGTDHTGIRLAHVPKALCTATTIDVYLYESLVSAGPVYTWQRVDGDFFIRVHGS